MDPIIAGALQDLAEGSLSTNVSLSIMGTVFYGISVPIFGRAIYIYAERRVASKASKVGLVATILCFSLFTVVSVANFSPVIWNVKRILDLTGHDLDTAIDMNHHKTFIDVIILDWADDIMYCISDILVVWRASVLLPRQKWIVAILIVLWLGNLAIAAATDILNSDFSSWLSTNEYSPEAMLWYHLSAAGTGLSLGLNILTTILIGIRMWVHRRLLVASGMRLSESHTKGPLILVWLVEAGLAFSLLQLINFLLQEGIARSSNADIIGNLDCAAWFFSCLFDFVTAIYPAVIIIMVDMHKSMIQAVEEASTMGNTFESRDEQT